MAAVKCSNKKQCDKLWSLTQVYINNKSQTKIQLANDSLIETYNPIQEGDYGLDATKTPGSGESAIIQLSFKCGGMGETGGLINASAISQLQTACANVGWNLLRTYEVEMKSASKKHSKLESEHCQWKLSVKVDSSNERNSGEQ